MLNVHKKLRRVHRRQMIIIVIALTAIVAVGEQCRWFGATAQPMLPEQPGLYRILAFDDGDTITVDMNGHPETIRFIGIDTPEIHDPRKAVQCYGQEASAFTRSFIGNSRVRLEADPLNTNRDRYDRLLRYVYLPDGTFVNAELVQRGYAFAYTSFPMAKAGTFQQLQSEARADRRGLWDACQPTRNDYGGYTSNDVSR